MRMSRGAVGLVIRIAITVSLLTILCFMVEDVRTVVRLIGGMAPPAFLAAVALSVFDRLMMAYKWWLLLRARQLAVTWWLAVRAYFASSLYGLVLPVTIGADAVRIFALRHAGTVQVTASVLVERSLGVIAMGSVALLSCLLLATAPSDLALESLTAWLLGVITISAGLFAISLVGADRAAARWVRAPATVRRTAEAYGTYRHHSGALVLCYGLSVVESLLSSGVVYIVAAGLGIPLPLWAAAATVPISLAVARLPISLGGWGVQETAFVYFAGIVGVQSNEALSIVLVSDIVMLAAFLPAAFDRRMITLRRLAAREDVV